MRAKVLRLLAGAAIVLAASSCSQSNQSAPQTLPRFQRAAAPAAVATPLNVKITEYPVIRNPQRPTIGPDGAVWFQEGSSAGQPPLGPLYVYRFAANDGQGRFFALSSLIKTLFPPNDAWAQKGPIVSYAGRIWLSYHGHTKPGYSTDFSSGLVQMTATGMAVNAEQLYFNSDMGAAAVQGDKLWLGPTDPVTANSTVTIQRLAGNELLPVRRIDLGSENPGIFVAAIRAGPDGNMYILGANGIFPQSVWKVSSAGFVLAQYRVGTLFTAVDMAFGTDRALWITTDRGFIRMRTDGTRTLFADPIPNSRPTAIALGRDGAMWFIDIGTNAIGRITLSGAITEYTVPSPNAFPRYVYASGIVACPTGIAACASGSIWFTEPNTSKLGKIQF